MTNSTYTIKVHAISLYNRMLDYGKYDAIVDRLSAEMSSDREGASVDDAIDLVTQAALGLCGYPDYKTSWLDLANFCEQNAITTSSIDAIHAYLLRFQQPGNEGADDFQRTAKLLIASNERLEVRSSEDKTDEDAETFAFLHVLRALHHLDRAGQAFERLSADPVFDRWADLALGFSLILDRQIEACLMSSEPLPGARSAVDEVSAHG